MVSSIIYCTETRLRILSFVFFVTVLVNAEILISPLHTEAVIEETVELHCKGTSGNIEWHHQAMGARYAKLVYKDDFIYNGYKERFMATETSDGKCSLLINGVKPSDAGKFICLENSETPLQVAAELIVLERFPSNESCSGKYTCKPVCDALELSCEMKAHGNHIPAMQWVDSGGKYIDATNDIVNEVTVSTIKLKSDPYRTVSYTCRLQYQKISMISKYNWTYSTSEWESFLKLVNSGTQSPPDSIISSVTLVVITTCAVTAIVSLIWVTRVLIRKKKRRYKQGMTTQISEETHLLMDPSKDAPGNAAKVKFATESKDDSIHSIAAIDNEVFITTRYGYDVKVFDLHGGKWKRSWSVTGLSNPDDMAACPIKKMVFICDWKKTTKDSEIYCLDIAGKLLCRWYVAEHEKGFISVTGNSNVLVTDSCYNTIKEYTSTGALINTIRTGQDKLHLWHAVKLSYGNFVACFGNAQDYSHEIRILSEEGRIIHSVRSDSTLPLSAERSVAADKKGNIYIRVLDNSKVIVLNPELKFKRFLDTTSDGDKLRGPLTICVHDFNNEGWLLVGNSGNEDRTRKCGRFAVWNLQDVLRESVSES